MTKTKEEKALYCREWREKNRERYLKKKRLCYLKNIKKYRDEAKIRARKYYYEVMVMKRKENPSHYKSLDRENTIKRREKRRRHLRKLRESLGGKCSHCGYNEEISILQFHHHLKNKEENVTNLQSHKKRELEAAKCILLCPNCHALHHLS